MHIGVACMNRMLISRIRAQIPPGNQISTIYYDDNMASRCVELQIDVLFSEVAEVSKASFKEWRELASLNRTDHVLILRKPSPELQLQAMRVGVYDVISDSKYDLGQDIRRILTGIERERNPKHLTEICIRSFGEAVVSIRGKRVVLTRTEYHVLRILINKKGIYVPTDFIIERVWGAHQMARREDLYVYISRLREKLEEHPNRPMLIRSSRGMGYAFVGDVLIERDFA